MNAVSPTLCGRPVATDRALVMAIVNRTPDSFYDRGATFSDQAAMAAVDRAVDEGADLVDIGGVKAGPGTTSTPPRRHGGWCLSLLGSGRGIRCCRSV